MFELLEPARAQMRRVMALATQVGLHHVDLGECAIGVGVGIPFDETHVVLLSISGGGNESQLLITSGVVRDIGPDDLGALRFCNDKTRDNPSLPCFVHQAEVGTDVLLQLRHPVNVLLATPQWFRSLVEAMPPYTDGVRRDLAEKAGVGGQPYRWDGEDLHRLLLRSML